MFLRTVEQEGSTHTRFNRLQKVKESGQKKADYKMFKHRRELDKIEAPLYTALQKQIGQTPKKFRVMMKKMETISTEYRKSIGLRSAMQTFGADKGNIVLNPRVYYGTPVSGIRSGGYEAIIRDGTL